MSIEYTCDGCGAKAKPEKSAYGKPILPLNWYSRRDVDGEQHAYSRNCIKKSYEKSGKTDLVLPI